MFFNTKSYDNNIVSLTTIIVSGIYMLCKISDVYKSEILKAS